MSGILLLIPTIIIGYFFKKKHFYLNYKFSKLNGHHLYFSSAAFGFIFVLISTIIYFIFVNIYIAAYCFFSDEYVLKISFFKSIRTIFSEKNFAINAFFIYILAILISWLLYLYEKKSIKGIDDLHNPLFFNIISDDPTDILLNLSASSENTDNSIDYEDRIIMLTMRDRKVYIGVVSEIRKNMFSRFSQGSDDFKFMPLISGYRDKDTLDLIRTTIYSDAVEKKLNITIVLKKSEILTLTKIKSDQLNNFLSYGNPLHKEVISSYKLKKKIIIKNSDDKYLLGIVSSSDYISEILLEKYPYFYFEIESNEYKTLKVLLSIDNIKEIYSGDNINEVLKNLI